MEFIGLFLYIAGLIVGLGAVVVIDVHGFLGQKSTYWTRATITAHKITKPLIWAGIITATIGATLFYTSKGEVLAGIPLYQLLLLIPMFLNGIFLSFYVSPELLKREKEGRSEEILPSSFQWKIRIGLLFSDAAWWLQVGLLTWYLLSH